MAPSPIINNADSKNLINLNDSAIIIFMALLTNILSELLSWAFIYRKRKYKECKKQIDSLNKKIEVAKESVKGKTKTVDKRLKQQETDLKSLNMDMMKVTNIELKILD